MILFVEALAEGAFLHCFIRDKIGFGMESFSSRPSKLLSEDIMLMASVYQCLIANY